MRNYEVVYILTPDLDEEQVEEQHNQVKTVIERYGGEAGEIDVWGKRRLAYAVDDYLEGTYAIRNFKGDSNVISELERSFRMNDSVLRYLVSRID